MRDKCLYKYLVETAVFLKNSLSDTVNDFYSISPNYWNKGSMGIFQCQFDSDRDFFFAPQSEISRHVLEWIEEKDTSLRRQFKEYMNIKSWIGKNDVFCYSFNIILKSEYEGIPTPQIFNYANTRIGIFKHIKQHNWKGQLPIEFLRDFHSNSEKWIKYFESRLDICEEYAYDNIFLDSVYITDVRDPVCVVRFVLPLPMQVYFATIKHYSLVATFYFETRCIKDSIDVPLLTDTIVDRLTHKLCVPQEYKIVKEDGIDTEVKIVFDLTQDTRFGSSALLDGIQQNLNLEYSRIQAGYYICIFKLKNNLGHLLSKLHSIWGDVI